MKSYRLLMKSRSAFTWTTIEAQNESLAKVLAGIRFPSCYGWYVEKCEEYVKEGA